MEGFMMTKSYSLSIVLGIWHFYQKHHF